MGRPPHLPFFISTLTLPVFVMLKTRNEPLGTSQSTIHLIIAFVMLSEDEASMPSQETAYFLYSALREDISMEKRYFTSDLSNLS